MFPFQKFYLFLPSGVAIIPNSSYMLLVAIVRSNRRYIKLTESIRFKMPPMLSTNEIFVLTSTALNPAWLQRHLLHQLFMESLAPSRSCEQSQASNPVLLVRCMSSSEREHGKSMAPQRTIHRERQA